VPDREPRTTVVVVTWRGRDLVGACLDALAAQTRRHRLLVVDNASADGTAAVLAAREVPAVRLRRNAGYAGALAAALPRIDTPYLAWLNDDAEPEPRWLAELESTLDRLPEVAAAGSVLLGDGGEVLSAGVRLTPYGYGADTGFDPAVSEVFGVCGGAALLRTGALRAVGGVPAGFFCYYEDTDTSWRLRLAGHRVVTVPSARVRHRHGASSGHGSPRFHRWNERNRLLMLLRCAPALVAARELARFAAITAALAMRRGVPDAPNLRAPLRLAVLAEVAARLPAALLARARIGRRSAVSRSRVWQRWAR
jgi:GT2 family glycosyltransferase